MNISSWGPEDVPFKELTIVFLLLSDRYSISFIPTFSHSPDEHNSEKGVAYPTTSNFWFASTFIYLTIHLKDDTVPESEIGHCPIADFRTVQSSSTKSQIEKRKAVKLLEVTSQLTSCQSVSWLLSISLRRA